MPQHIRELVGKRLCNSKYGNEYVGTAYYCDYSK
jgi:hypothetical protein